MLVSTEAPSPSATGSNHEAVGVLGVKQWVSGRPPEALDWDQIDSPWSPDDGVLCIVVSRWAHDGDLFDTLAPVCGPVLTLPMIKDVLDSDALPKITLHAGGRARSVAFFDVETIRDSARINETGRLIFGSVEMLAGPGWLIVCSQERETFPRTDEGECLCEQRLRECADGRPLFKNVAQRWSDGNYSKVDDLGVLLLHESTLGYRKADQALHDWVEAWEVQLFNDHDVERQTLKQERDTLCNLRLVMAEYRRRLSALHCAGQETADGWSGTEGCFAGATDVTIARRAQRHLEHSLTDLKELNGMLRSTFDLVQVQLSQRQQKATETLNRRLELVAAIFLVPTLIAGIFGANTAVPGEAKWNGFAIMIVTMVLGALLVFLVLRTMSNRSERSARAVSPAEGR